MSVFIISSDFKVVLNPDAVKLVPELRSLTQEELIYVILVVDYVDSPLKSKPFEERQRMACRKVFKKDFDESIETGKIKQAMTSYKGLVFDIRRETLDAYKRRVKTLHSDLLMDNLSAKNMKDLDSSVQFLEARIASIENDVNRSDQQNLELKGQKKLSFLEMYQRNQNEFKEFIADRSTDGEL
jgi:predicted  nucleic acid-binding Zn-ribbon protein